MNRIWTVCRDRILDVEAERFLIRRLLPKQNQNEMKMERTNGSTRPAEGEMIERWTQMGVIACVHARKHTCTHARTHLWKARRTCISLASYTSWTQFVGHK